MLKRRSNHKITVMSTKIRDLCVYFTQREINHMVSTVSGRGLQEGSTQTSIRRKVNKFIPAEMGHSTKVCRFIYSLSKADFSDEIYWFEELGIPLQMVQLPLKTRKSK